jgi:hypothetical protein
VNASEGSTNIGFAGAADFALTMRIAECLSHSDFVADAYRDEIEVKDRNGRVTIQPNPRATSNIVVALELANRLGITVTEVMQNLYVVNGRPAWMSTFLISSINRCGRFHSLRFDMGGAGETRQCIAWTCEKRFAIPDNVRTLADAIKVNLPVLEGTAITWAMVKEEGWLDKRGSKWRTMPDQMFKYRAATFWTRVYSPELTMGIRAEDEVDDIAQPAQSSNGDRAAQVSAVLNGNGHRNGTNGKTEEPPAPSPTPGASSAPEPPPVIVPAAARTTKERMADIEQLERLSARIHQAKWDGLPTHLKNEYNVHSAKALKSEQIEELIAFVRKKIEKAQGPEQ